jgi:transcriptional regulator with XRE-family HTH domain
MFAHRLQPCAVAFPLEMKTAAQRIGDDIRRAMEGQGVSIGQLAERTGKSVEHIEAVLDGYPNTMKRPTQLDTVDEIAQAVGLKLSVSELSSE